MFPGIIPNVAQFRNMPLWNQIAAFNLPAAPNVCMDFGSSKCYAGSGQSLVDLSGSGDVYNLGATSSSEASDPTFSGAANSLSASEFFSTDGGDFFRVASQPAWVQAMHKASAKTSAVFWAQVGATAGLNLFGTSNALAANVGVVFVAGNSGGVMRYIVNKGSASALDTSSSGPAFSRNTWQMYSLSHDATAGAGGSFFGVNNAYTTFDGTLATPSAGSATYSLELFGIGNGGSSNVVGSGGRMASGAIWSGLALTQTQVTNIFNATRRRFGV